jgi:hypothetical protein
MDSQQLVDALDGLKRHIISGSDTSIMASQISTVVRRFAATLDDERLAVSIDSLGAEIQTRVLAAKRNPVPKPEALTRG